MRTATRPVPPVACAQGRRNLICDVGAGFQKACETARTKVKLRVYSGFHVHVQAMRAALADAARHQELASRGAHAAWGRDLGGGMCSCCPSPYPTIRVFWPKYANYRYLLGNSCIVEGSPVVFNILEGNLL